MTKVLLCLHILAVIIAIGPVTVAASMFPAAARRALSVPAQRADRPGSAEEGGDAEAGGDRAVVRTLHRICRIYSLVGIAVPVFGFAVGGEIGILGRPWLIASIALTAAAAAVLIFLVLPGQDAVVAKLGEQHAGTVTTAATTATRATTASRVTSRLAMQTGIFNLLWVVVAVLMVIHPGAPKGA